MTRKPPELPNIEDATLRACLAPLVDAMHAGAETTPSEPAIAAKVRTERPNDTAGSNDNPAPASEPGGARECEYSGTPKTLAEWRSLSDADFGAFRTIELFLTMTDAELKTAAAEFPRQIGGTIARIGRIRRRLLAQYDTATTATALLERALDRVAPGREDDGPRYASSRVISAPPEDD
jgi:hypothetical protein